MQRSRVTTSFETKKGIADKFKGLADHFVPCVNDIYVLSAGDKAIRIPESQIDDLNDEHGGWDFTPLYDEARAFLRSDDDTPLILMMRIDNESFAALSDLLKESPIPAQ